MFMFYKHYSDKLKAQRSVVDLMVSASGKPKYGLFSSHQQETVNRDIVIWIALDLLPFSDVNSPGLKYFFSKHATHINIPDESRLRKKYLGEVYARVAETVKSELSGASTLNLMFEGWSAKYNEAH